MQIINAGLSFGKLVNRESTEKIIIHHSASDNDDVWSIHNYHVNVNKWNGIGYHFVIHQNGDVYEGRPINTIGAHAQGENSDSIGICVCGNLDKNNMTKEQEQSLKELLVYIRNIYGELQLMRHSDVNNTTCPGKNFNDKILLDVMAAEEKINDIDEALKVLFDRKIINSPNYWKNASALIIHLKQLLINVANYVK